MSEFPWPNLDNPEVVCGTFAYEDDAEETWHRLAKLVKESGRTKQYGVFLEPYGNVFRLVVRDRLATAKIKRVRQEKQQTKRQKRD